MRLLTTRHRAAWRNRTTEGTVREIMSATFSLLLPQLPSAGSGLSPDLRAFVIYFFLSWSRKKQNSGELFQGCIK